MAGARSDLILRPLEAGDEVELRRIRETPEVYRWWGPVEDDFPFGDEPEAVRQAIVAGGLLVGMVQYGEEDEPMYRNANIDLFVDPALHGRGIGSNAVRLVAGHLIENRGHHRITIDPAADNAAAIRCYAKVGFKPVGIMRRYERDPLTGEWRDGLMMDLLADELGAPPDEPGDAP